EDGIRDFHVTGVQTCALPICVFVSPDGAEVTAPLSIGEYLLTFHEIARRTPGCREGICRAGEVFHVPAGWFHMVVNLEDGIAVRSEERRVGREWSRRCVSEW